jgi:hypothetical protein
MRVYERRKKAERSRRFPTSPLGTFVRILREWGRIGSDRRDSGLGLRFLRRTHSHFGRRLPSVFEPIRTAAARREVRRTREKPPQMGRCILNKFAPTIFT